MVMTTNLSINQLELGPMGNFVYLIGNRQTKEAFVVDPGWQTDTILKVAKEEGYKIIGALLTHAHFDHVGGLAKLIEKTGGMIYVHQDEAARFESFHNKVMKTIDHQVIPLGEMKIQVVHTPGHTLGSQCFLVEGNLFTGDTLFINACGRCDLRESDPQKMYHSLKRLAAMDDNIVVWPGHHYGDAVSSTIGEEKRNNPYLQKAGLDSFLSF